MIKGNKIIINNLIPYSLANFRPSISLSRPLFYLHHSSLASLHNDPYAPYHLTKTYFTNYNFITNLVDFLDTPLFIERVMDFVPKDFDYLVIIKIKHNEDRYKMAGNQFSLSFRNIGNMEYDLVLHELHDTVWQRVKDILEEYKINLDCVMNIQI